MGEALLGAIKAAMQSLVDSYGLRVVGETADRNYVAVKYANNTTGLKVAVDWSELRPFITVYELTGGMFPPDFAGSGIPGSRREAFDVDDLLLLRPVSQSPVGKMFGGRNDHDAMRLLSDYARALGQEASDVLSGDFTVFDELEQIVARREERMRGGA